MSAPSYEERIKIINKTESSGSAFPFDQINVLAVKCCPIFRTTLHRIISHCWSHQKVSKCWKLAIIILIYEKISPENPDNFTPIRFEPIYAKVFTTLIRNPTYTSLVESNIQKGFWGCVSGKVGRTGTLIYFINLSRRYHRNLVTLLNLRNVVLRKRDNDFIQAVLSYQSQGIFVILLQNYARTFELQLEPILIS